MCGSKPKMPATAAAPPPIPDATPGAVAPIIGNDKTQARRFDALRELSKLVIPGTIQSVAPSGAVPLAPEPARPPAPNHFNPTRGVGTPPRRPSSPATPGAGSRR